MNDLTDFEKVIIDLDRTFWRTEDAQYSLIKAVDDLRRASFRFKGTQEDEQELSDLIEEGKELIGRLGEYSHKIFNIKKEGE